MSATVDLTATVCIDASAAAVWSWLARIEDIPLWSRGIISARSVPGRERGPGAERVCELVGGITLSERWLSWDEGVSFTYEQMAAHWPTATGDYAGFMNSLPKVVFSKTLPAAEWPGSRIARGDLAEEIAALKSEPGGEIMAHGGAAFVQSLSRLGLVDEYRLVILPVALGSGLPLFKDLPKPLRVDLAEARSFPDGTVIHVYRPRR